MKTENLSSAGLTVIGTVTGSMASRVASSYVPITNAKIKHGVLAVVSILGASLLDRKDPTNAFIQDVAIGASATQIGSLVKELLGEKTGVIKTALGTPKFLGTPRRYNFIPRTRVKRMINSQPENKQVRFKAS